MQQSLEGFLLSTWGCYCRRKMNIWCWKYYRKLKRHINVWVCPPAPCTQFGARKRGMLHQQSTSKRVKKPCTIHVISLHLITVCCLKQICAIYFTDCDSVSIRHSRHSARPQYFSKHSGQGHIWGQGILIQNHVLKIRYVWSGHSLTQCGQSNISLLCGL